MKSLDDISPNHSIAFLLLILFLLLLPILPQVSTYHSDEHYYTDSAVYMNRHGDYLSPHLNDGTLRTNKPIITYWMILAGYAVFGVNFFAARFPFLLAGCLTVWLTYKIAMQLFKQQRVALLSAIILATNMQFLMLCLRATPDVLQVLFMNVTLFGFIAVVFNDDGRLRNYLFIYFGAALVAQTKGLLGVVVIGFIFAYYFLSKQHKRCTLPVTHWPVMAMAAGMALSWYVYIFFQHGLGALGRFYTDQVTGKINGTQYYMLVNIKDYAWGVFSNFLPWSFVLALGYVGQRKAVHDALKQHRQAVVFILSWFALILAIFIGSTDCRTRYLVPAYPLLSILIASLFWQLFEKGGIDKIWKWLCGALLALLAVGSLAVLCIGTILQWQVMVGGLILLVWGLAAAWDWRRNRGKLPLSAMALVLLVIFAIPRWLVLPIFEFAPSKDLAACILAEPASEQPVIVWSSVRANFLRQLYTVSQGRILVHYFKRGALPDHLDARSLVVLTKDEKASYPSDDYLFEPCGAVFRVPALDVFWRALLNRERDPVYQAMQDPIFLARRQSIQN
jgi:4-amino-4-deoxy-L-arabinose transferase-like glycosyltransferase